MLIYVVLGGKVRSWADSEPILLAYVMPDPLTITADVFFALGLPYANVVYEELCRKVKIIPVDLQVITSVAGLGVPSPLLTVCEAARDAQVEENVHWLRRDQPLANFSGCVRAHCLGI